MELITLHDYCKQCPIHGDTCGLHAYLQHIMIYIPIPLVLEIVDVQSQKLPSFSFEGLNGGHFTQRARRKVVL